MTRPRSQLVSVADTPYYHIGSRCVRRSFLCGEDKKSGKNFEHRRGWITERIHQLSCIFAIDVAAYAVMSNHYHLVLHLDKNRAERWSDEEVLQRWTMLFSGPMVVQRYLSDDRKNMDESLINLVAEYAAEYRTRLHDLSWFMRCLNQNKGTPTLF